MGFGKVVGKGIELIGAGAKKLAKAEQARYVKNKASNVAKKVKDTKDIGHAAGDIKTAKRYAARNAAVGTVAATYVAPKALSLAKQYEIKKKDAPASGNAKKVADNAAKVAANAKKVADNAKKVEANKKKVAANKIAVVAAKAKKK